MASVKPYTISVPQSKIDTLKQKLALTEFPDELEDAGWDMGTPLADVKRLAEKWQTWDWREAEKKLNKLPHFHTDIEVTGFGTLDIHFIHQKSDVAGAIPLLFVHGWPGSFIEVAKILPLLTNSSGDGPAFHVVAPSLPNYGFSEGVSRRGFAMAQYAETCNKLMLQLGYSEYVTQGGDWGSHITRTIGYLYPESCKANHVNMVVTGPPTFAKEPLLALQHALQPYTERDTKGFERAKWFDEEGRGYNLQQSTKPQTLAYSLHDSPVGLLAWIYEKLHDWSDDYPWTDDEILTWISIYQFSRAGPGAAHRIYYELNHVATAKKGGKGQIVTREQLTSYLGPTKLGITRNPKELGPRPHTWGRKLGKVIFEVDNDHGGHFYAHECPELLVRDLKNMFGKTGPAYKIVSEKEGY